MKKEVLNILFLAAVGLAVAWLYWPASDLENSDGQMDAGDNASLVLALSWQPAFCEGKPNKPECRTQRENRFDASHFSLHGLWPQPRENVYCNLDPSLIEKDKKGRWNELPKLAMSEALRRELAQVMPGYRSSLHRHEWYKHGVCMGNDVTPQAYYRLSMDLLEQVNQSALRDLFFYNIGKEISAKEISRIMEMHFGKGAGRRIAISCKRDGSRTLITGLKISLVQIQTKNTSDINSMMALAPELQTSCRRGLVDPVGLQ